MEVVDEETGRPIKKLSVILTEEEARTLHEHLAALFEDDPLRLTWHMHLGKEGHVEVSIGLAEP